MSTEEVKTPGLAPITTTQGDPLNGLLDDPDLLQQLGANSKPASQCGKLVTPATKEKALDQDPDSLDLTALLERSNPTLPETADRAFQRNVSSSEQQVQTSPTKEPKKSEDMLLSAMVQGLFAELMGKMKALEDKVSAVQDSVQLLARAQSENPVTVSPSGKSKEDTVVLSTPVPPVRTVNKEETKATPEFVGFTTGRMRKVRISLENLKRASSLFQENDDLAEKSADPVAAQKPLARKIVAEEPAPAPDSFLQPAVPVFYNRPSPAKEGKAKPDLDVDAELNHVFSRQSSRVAKHPFKTPTAVAKKPSSVGTGEAVGKEGQHPLAATQDPPPLTGSQEELLLGVMEEDTRKGKASEPPKKLTPVAKRKHAEVSDSSSGLILVPTGKRSCSTKNTDQTVLDESAQQFLANLLERCRSPTEADASKISVRQDWGGKTHPEPLGKLPGEISLSFPCVCKPNSMSENVRCTVCDNRRSVGVGELWRLLTVTGRFNVSPVLLSKVEHGIGLDRKPLPTCGVEARLVPALARTAVPHAGKPGLPARQKVHPPLIYPE